MTWAAILAMVLQILEFIRSRRAQFSSRPGGIPWRLKLRLNRLEKAARALQQDAEAEQAREQAEAEDHP